MVKNPDYWGKDAAGNQLPYLDRLEYVMVEDESAAEPAAAVRRASTSAADDLAGLRRRSSSDPNLRVDIYPSTGIREVAFNVTKDPWQDVRLRQAVAYCLDRDAINKALYDGRSNLGYDTFWEPTVFPGSPTPPTRVPRTTRRPSNSSPTPARPRSTSS